MLCMPVVDNTDLWIRAVFLNRCALVCREILPSVPPNFLVLTFTTVLWIKEILAAISKIKLFFKVLLCCVDHIFYLFKTVLYRHIFEKYHEFEFNIDL
jgi:hypothetical protein